jgi:hypothetical protein
MDKYTKAVLTVITVCLMIQTGEKIVQPAYADNIQKIAICEYQNPSQCVRVDGRALRVTE